MYMNINININVNIYIYIYSLGRAPIRAPASAQRVGSTLNFKPQARGRAPFAPQPSWGSSTLRL